MTCSSPISLTLSASTWRSILRREGQALEILRRALNMERNLILADIKARKCRPLGELWSEPGVVVRALNELNCQPEVRGRIITLRCPGCGHRRAYLYRDMLAPRIACNRRNSCPVGRSGPVLLFRLLEDKAGSRRRAFELIRSWAK